MGPTQMGYIQFLVPVSYNGFYKWSYYPSTLLLKYKKRGEGIRWLENLKFILRTAISFLIQSQGKFNTLKGLKVKDIVETNHTNNFCKCISLECLGEVSGKWF